MLRAKTLGYPICRLSDGLHPVDRCGPYDFILCELVERLWPVPFDRVNEFDDVEKEVPPDSQGYSLGAYSLTQPRFDVRADLHRVTDDLLEF